MTLLSASLAVAAREGRMSRNEARRRLMAEAKRRYGKAEVVIMRPRLVQFANVARRG